ncbi:MAG TPA: hypothetical protein VGZ00_02040 [Candidatus Baltobacteraceae bacterium]|jgi:hypothetical protein|nr:hypothetical protein [Candidatus Baltobacteraceae bacterium]
MGDAVLSNDDTFGEISSEGEAKFRPLMTFLEAGMVMIVAEAAVQTFEISNIETATMVAGVQITAAEKLLSATTFFLEAPLLLNEIEAMFRSTPKNGAEKHGILTAPDVIDIAMQTYVFTAASYLSPTLLEKFKATRQALLKSRKSGTERSPASIQRMANDIKRVIKTKPDQIAMDKMGAHGEKGEGWDADLQANFRGLLYGPFAKLFSDGFSAEDWLRDREKALYANQHALQAKITATARNADSIEQKEEFQTFLRKNVLDICDEITPELRSNMRALLGIRAEIKKKRGNQPQVKAVRFSNTKISCN